MPYIIDTYSQSLAHAYKEDVSDVLDSIVRADVAFLGLVGSGGTATALKHFWLADDVAPETVLSKEAITGGAISTMDVPDADAQWLKVGAILKDKAVDELVRVTVIGAAGSGGGAETLITIVKHPGGDANFASNHADEAVFRIVGMPSLQGGTPTEDAVVQRSEMFNAVQIFERGIKVTDETGKIEARGVPNEMAYQIAKKTIDVKRELAFSVLYGKYALASSTSTYSTMGGILEFLNVASANRVNANGAAITATMLNDGIQKIQDKGVSNPSHIVVGTAAARVISGWDSSTIRRDASDKQRGIVVDSFLSDLGVALPIVHEKELDPGFAMIIRSSDLKLMAFDAWSKYTWPRTTYADKQTLKGSYTFEIRNAYKAHCLIYGLS